MVARPESFVSAPACDGRGGCDRGDVPSDVDRLRAVLFGWDGTLADSHGLNCRAWHPTVPSGG